MNEYSDLLFADPSFLGGAARALDIGAVLVEFNRSMTPEQADYNAISADWRAVGDDLRRAVALYETSMVEAPDAGA